MSEISLTASMRSNLLSLQNIASQQDIVQNRLATGLKVSSAIDNPSSYYTASSLNNRATDLTALLDAMSQGIQTIKAASETIESGTKFLEQAKAVASSALETTEPIIATVTNEAELLAAVNSEKQGLIVIDGTINMSVNSNISLKTGQSLVGAKYLGLSDRYGTINFEMSGISRAGINTVDGALISDLNINYKTDTKAWGSAAIRNAAQNGCTLQNLNITVEAALSADSNAVCSGIYSTADTIVNLHGTVNIRAPQQADAGRRIYGISGHGTFNVTDNSKLNILTEGTLGFAVALVQLNIMNNAEANLNSYGYPMLSQPSINNSIALLSSTSRLNLQTNKPDIFYGSNGVDGDLIFSAVKGAQINAAGRRFTALEDVNKAMIQRGNTLNNTFNGQDNKFRDEETSPAVTDYFDDIFDDFADFMNSSSQNSSAHLSASGAAEYTGILKQYDNLIRDGSYKGVNLLQEQNLKINFNEDRSSKIEVKGVSADSLSLGLKTTAWENTADIEQSITELESAINTLRSFASEFGNYYNLVTTREDFTENLINVLEEGADKLTLADMNQESANMLALQTSQQLAVNSLSLASQASQSILKLF